MSNQLAVSNIQARLPMPTGIDDMDARKWRVLCESVYPSAKTPEAVVMAIDYCRARGLDPFKRPVNIVPMWNSSLGKEVETIWPGINEVQTTAARTGKYAGMDEPKWGEMKTRKFEGTRKYKDGNTWKEEKMSFDLSYPEWCSVTVYRMVEGVRCAFTEPVYWEEAYAKAGKTDCPNKMWQTRPRGQLLKVAKAFSLRAAFPEEGEYTAEEMEGKEIQHGGVVIDQQAPITPFDIDNTKPASPFKTNAARTDFQKSVIASYTSAKTHKFLEERVSADEAMINSMKNSGDSRDQQAVEEIRKSYQLNWNRIIREEQAAIDELNEQEKAREESGESYIAQQLNDL